MGLISCNDSYNNYPFNGSGRFAQRDRERVPPSTGDAAMEPFDRAPEAKKEYEAPEILASYEKEELEELVQPEAQTGGSGCGCGSIL